MGRYDVLFEPVQIGPKTAPNRFYAVPHATGHGWNQPNGEIALRAMKAEGGWGTVAVQMTEIGPDADMGNHPMQRLWDDTDIPRHAKRGGLDEPPSRRFPLSVVMVFFWRAEVGA